MAQLGSLQPLDSRTETWRSSEDSTTKSRLSSTLDKTGTKHNKRVHWHPDVIDNEHKMFWAPEISVSTRPLMLGWSNKPSNATPVSQARPKGSGNSLKTIESDAKHVSTNQRSRPSHMQASGALQSSMRNVSSLSSNLSEVCFIRPDVASWLMETPCFEPVDVLTQRTKRPRAVVNRANSRKSRELAHKYSISQTAESNKVLQNSGIQLPAAPDPPRRRGPPPTPRISRIPTPELSDISDEEFCTFHVGYNSKTFASKMTAQLNAAKVHMKEQKGKSSRSEFKSL